MASVINQIKLGNTEYAIAASAYAECSTAGSATDKAATICTDGDTTNNAFTLVKGVSVQVKFTNTNTAANPTLNINSTGAKPIYYTGSAITAGYLVANRVFTFVYNGTQWDLVGTINTNTTYNLAAPASKTNGDVTIDLTGTNGSGTDSVKITGSGATTVTTDANGVITIDSTNSETTLTIADKSNIDTTDLVYAVTNLVEGGTKGHAITPTYVGLPTKVYVDKMVTGAVEYLGTVTGLTGLSTTAGKGDFYRVSTEFTFSGTEKAHVGDILLATKDNPAQNATDWDLIHTEVDSNTWVENKVNAAGYVTAPGTSNANKVWKTDGSGNPGWRDDADTGATNVEVTGSGNAITTATYDATTRKLTLNKGATYNNYSHPLSGVTAGSYNKVTVDANGHVTGGSNPTTLSGHGITDAYTKAEIDAKINNLFSHGTDDPSSETTSQYYFKYN